METKNEQVFELKTITQCYKIVSKEKREQYTKCIDFAINLKAKKYGITTSTPHYFNFVIVTEFETYQLTPYGNKEFNLKIITNSTDIYT